MLITSSFLPNLYAWRHLFKQRLRLSCHLCAGVLSSVRFEIDVTLRKYFGIAKTFRFKNMAYFAISHLKLHRFVKKYLLVVRYSDRELVCL